MLILTDHINRSKLCQNPGINNVSIKLSLLKIYTQILQNEYESGGQQKQTYIKTLLFYDVCCCCIAFINQHGLRTLKVFNGFNVVQGQVQILQHLQAPNVL